VEDTLVGAGRRKSGGVGNLGSGTGGVVIFARPGGTGSVDRVPYDDLYGMKVVAAATSSETGPSIIYHQTLRTEKNSGIADIPAAGNTLVVVEIRNNTGIPLQR